MTIPTSLGVALFSFGYFDKKGFLRNEAIFSCKSLYKVASQFTTF